MDSSTKPTPSDQTGDMPPLPRSPLGHKLMFGLLVLISFAMFTPAVMLPKLRDYGRLLDEETRLKNRVTALNDEARYRAELTEAFARDTIVNERLAVLDLGYRKPHEEVYAVSPDEFALPESTATDAPVHRSALLMPDDWPGWAIDAEAWAQERGLVDLFLDESLHPVFLLMSGGMLVAAFVLFAPRLPRRRTQKSIITAQYYRGAKPQAPMPGAGAHI